MTTAPYPPTGPLADLTPVPLYSEEFAADPHAAYAWMRQRFGSLVPVELHPGVPATLVIGYYTALRVLHDPVRFPADPRIWQSTVPADCPILPMTGWRPNALRNSGAAHERYRSANSAALDAVDLHHLRATVQRAARDLITDLARHGQADLVTQYALPLAFQVLNALLDCPPRISVQVADGMARVFDSAQGAGQGEAMISQALAALVALKRADPGDDITSRLIAHHTRLSDEELVHQLVTLYGAGIEPQTHLIANALRLTLTDERFAGSVIGGSLTVRDALEEVLHRNPPLAQYCLSYPPLPVVIDGVLLPAHQPVVIGMAACNSDPAVARAGRVGNRSHLAFSAGAHACPARTPAYVIAQSAVELLIDALPEMQLAVPADELRWRPGPFHRALASLPVRFPTSVPVPVR
ncbi:cytochrome P450 [Kitasatospora sp. NPDC001603]|uniref:cytochrome P450 n=1 Tax=Kitasatospora sp. NPDC001603 TaxID=3154388 RepID=UPI003328AD5C